MRVLPLQWLHEIEASLETHDFVEAMLGNGSASVVYGEPNCGKTFFALDLGLSVARGVAFFGREVIQGGVIYLALEGGYGAVNRVAAYLNHYEISEDDASRVPFALANTSINLLKDRSESDVSTVVNAVLAAADRIGEEVRLIIIDTLSRALGGGDENSPEDMGGMVQAIDEIRAKTGAHVMLIHHSGKDQARGMRGHSSLKGAIDTEIEVTKVVNGDATRPKAQATVTKQRDYASGAVFTFRLYPIELGKNDRGRAVTSCVILAEDAPEPVSKPKKPAKVPAGYAVVLRALETARSKFGRKAPAGDNYPAAAVVVTETQWRDEFYAIQVGMKPNSRLAAFRRGFEWLSRDGRVRSYNGLAWITDRSSSLGSQQDTTSV